MAEQSPRQKQIVERVMHDFKKGDLEKRDGAPVADPKQAIAIALHEAGSSNRESPAKNKQNLRKTERRDRDGEGQTRAALYAEAKRRDLPGRSTMSKAQLERALRP